MSRPDAKSHRLIEAAWVSDWSRTAATPPTATGEAVKAVLAGNIFKVHVAPGAVVNQGDPLLIVEAMKMETAVVAPRSATVTDVFVSEGDSVSVGDALVAID